jgi:hypothetical protein
MRTAMMQRTCVTLFATSMPKKHQRQDVYSSKCMSLQQGSSLLQGIAAYGTKASFPPNLKRLLKWSQNDELQWAVILAKVHVRASWRGIVDGSGKKKLYLGRKSHKSL